MLISLLCSALFSAGERIDTRFVQVAPVHVTESPWQRSPDEDCAVVLIHGLRIHPFSSARARRADFQAWQTRGSGLVSTLASEADIYAFAYSQNAELTAIVDEGDLSRHVLQLQVAGYKDIVLIGHSAGGLFARQFVEDHPDAGVTKVIQVCSPNGGSSLGQLTLGVCDCQEAFLRSLSKSGRRDALLQRGQQRIPDDVEFVCLVGQLKAHVQTNLAVELDDGRTFRLTSASLECGDGVLSIESQWPEDLREQGIPAYTLPAAHFTAMFSNRVARRLADLITQPQPRWTAMEVGAAAAGMPRLAFAATVEGQR